MNALITSNNVQIGGIIYIILLKTLFLVGNTIAYMTFSSLMNFSVYWRSSLLTNAFIVGFMLSHQSSYPALISFGYYTMCLSFFHLSEFVITALYNEEVTTDSFLLNHSLEYGLAALASWTEFTVEVFFFPQLKMSLYTRFVGLFLVMFGELFRKLAMYTAGTNFNHYIQERKKRDHILVQTGVYSLVRHPSYFGWFFWSIGTQILLANPICAVLYTIATWKFFKSRILYEEFHLIKFFGKEYINYQAKVPSGIPFVKGCIMYAEPSLD
jgi:protein-S-isoprenylcysteine O-methyltransferase